MQDNTTNARTGARLRRETVTFRAYYTNAHNAIVKPNLTNRYLLRRWAKDLGHLGLHIVLALRDRAYYDPGTGELRNDLELRDMKELGQWLGCSERTLIREFQRNRVLAEFVRRGQVWEQASTSRLQRAGTVYYVAMDDPIHPLDEAAYQRLKSEMEARDRADKHTARSIPPRIIAMRRTPSPFDLDGEDRPSPISDTMAPVGEMEAVPHGCQSVTHGGQQCQSVTCGGQSVTQDGQNVPEFGQAVTCTNKESPDSSLTFSILSPDAPAGAAPSHKCVPPGGEGRGGTPAAAHGIDTAAAAPPDPLRLAWERALEELAGAVNKPTLEAHLRTLSPVSITKAGEVTLSCPSAFTRDWIDKRHGAQLASALTRALGRPADSPAVTVRLVLAAPPPAPAAAGQGGGRCP